MVYEAIQPAAFVPVPEALPFVASQYVLAFPRSWRDPILELYRHGKGDPCKIKSVPIRRLNAVIRAVAPDLISVAADAPLDDSRPWLYASRPYPVPVMSRFINAWLTDMQPRPEDFPLVRAAATALDVPSLRWEQTEVNLLEHTTSTGGTADPAPHLYRLLPEILASRITRLPPYEHNGEQITFVQLAANPWAGGGELMSWPPLTYRTKTRDGWREWNYSAVLRVSLRTAAFSPIPRIHVSVGIRRWVRGTVWMPAQGAVSAVLRSGESLVPDGPAPHRFAVAQLVWDAKTGTTRWRHGGPEGMLMRISAEARLPSPELMIKEPESWLTGRDGVTAAVVYHTMMGRHGVGAGIMPSERRRIVEWAAQALHPEFTPMGQLRRASIKTRKPTSALDPQVSVPKNASDDERADFEARNDQIARRNADQRRACTAAAVGERGLTVLFLYQNDHMRDTVIAAAEHSLNLTGARRDAGPRTWSWQTSELAVRIVAEPLGALGEPLGGAKAPRRGAETQQAMTARRIRVRDHIDRLQETIGDKPRLIIVELEGREAFKRRTSDPKFAIRLGCADAGSVSQFIRPPDPNDEDDNAAFRAAAAWNDGLRQVGTRFVPTHSLGEEAIPPNLNQLAFWLVKRRSNEQFGRQFTPIAILIRPEQNSIMGRSPELGRWVPYPELLTSLTGEVRGDNCRTRQQQADHAAAFFKPILYQFRSEPTLLVTHAQNTRERWDWLKNPNLVADKIQIGAGPYQRLDIQGRHLRIARIATGDRDETFEWWAPTPAGGGGIAAGLWLPPDADDNNRVFYSTTEKAGSHTIAVTTAKLTSHFNEKGQQQLKPGKNAWNPGILEIAMVGLQSGDIAEDWAMFLHQQRYADDYRDALKLPLILHLANLANEYALPHEDAEQAQTDDSAEETESNTEFPEGPSDS